jgi:hypothetical protein
MMDWHSRKVLTWHRAYFMTAEFYVAALEENPRSLRHA